MSAEIRWRLTKPVSRPVPASGPRADPDRNPARVLSAIALASLAAGAINDLRHRGSDSAEKISAFCPGSRLLDSALARW